ncbi:MAG: membrane protein insertion efficiency factor YidD [Lachnospiraceae bacterium]|nr:membrane protein insertion efficiency factor YidD [Lachnospiraceae bacterium]
MKRFLIFIIRLYQDYISPLKTTRCPYYPSCSAYGLEAVERFGAIKGGALALWRILRCNPFSKGGVDPVPLKYKSFSGSDISLGGRKLVRYSADTK